MIRKNIAILLLLLLIPGAALAQEAPPASNPPGQPPILFGGVEPLMSKQKEVLDLLLAQKWKLARDLASQQLYVLAGYVDKYPGLVATALSLEALADAGLGNEGAAACRWQWAQNLDPKLTGADLSAFGEAGALLKKRPFQPPSASDPETLRIAQPQAGKEKKEKKEDEVQRPELRAQQRPVYPLAARKAGTRGTVVVEAIIEKDGSIANPNVLQHQPLGLDVAAVDAACGWQFKPATLEGKPVKVYYVLTVNFQP
ncbi:MAG TPA: energy transducer TonB [Thermoanaerobaculia bacterium]